MWLTTVVLAGGLGVVLGWEEFTFKNDKNYQSARTGWPKTITLLTFAGALALYVETVRGFFVVYLSALGAYYLFKQIGQFLQIRWYRWRDPHPIAESLRSSKDGETIEFYLRSKCSSPVKIETMFLRGSGNRIIPIDQATIFQKDCAPDSDGWLRLDGYELRSRGLGPLALQSKRMPEVEMLRLIGTYANGEHWVVDQEL
jgi:hypothetical protein